MIELKKCPFCGNQPFLDFAKNCNHTYTGKDGKLYQTELLFTIRCNCGCSIGDYEETTMAMEAWNRRVNE